MSKLGPQQLKVRAKSLNKEWEIYGHKLKREFLFSSYNASIIFVNNLAQLAESQNHHPTILIGYRKVSIEITTHDAGNNLTKKDFDLALSIDKFHKIKNPF